MFLNMDDLRDARAAAACSSAAAVQPILKYLRFRRANHTTTNPLEVYRLTSKVLECSTSKALSESDRWSVSEDHVIACVQLGRADEALAIVNIVTGRFPRSCRAARLKGMYFESVGSFDEARATYDAALRIDPDNLMINHRVAALKAGRGDIVGALEDLHKHLTTHLGDYQAWYEAGKLHTRQGAYAKAVFCFEEVLMHQPGTCSSPSPWPTVCTHVVVSKTFVWLENTMRAWWSRVAVPVSRRCWASANAAPDSGRVAMRARVGARAASRNVGREPSPWGPSLPRR